VRAKASLRAENQGMGQVTRVALPMWRRGENFTLCAPTGHRPRLKQRSGPRAG
jgi:hypothetical protein